MAKIKHIAIITAILLLITIITPLVNGIHFLNDKHLINSLYENDKSFIDSQSTIKNYQTTRFVENRGQLENDEVRYYDQSGAVWFTDSGVWFELREYADTRGRGSEARNQGGVRDELSINSRQSTVHRPKSRLMTDDRQLVTNDNKRVILKQEFLGANIVRPEGIAPLDSYYNYFYGQEPSDWLSNVPSYREIFYNNIYHGIDLRYYTNENGLKYDFIIEPEADPAEIRIQYIGDERLELDKNGDLIIQTSLGNIIEEKSIIYQIYDENRIEISGNFILYNDFEYGFEINDDYNKQIPLIIDPSVKLEYSTYIGGTGNEDGADIALDSSGNTYITGWTGSLDFPTTTGAYNESFNNLSDIYVLKLNNDFTAPIYSTYIGGDLWDVSYGIAIDSNGNSYITGETASNDFPTTALANDTTNNGGFYDAFVLKLNHNGSKLVYSTYIGGIEYDKGHKIQVDSSDNVYVTGATRSPDFPATPGANQTTFQGGNFDIFVVKLNHDGSTLIYSTFLGGSSEDVGHDIAIDGLGNAFVTGYTASTDFYTSPNAYDTTHNGTSDMFVLKLNYTGKTIDYSTYVAGQRGDFGNGIVIDPFGNAIIAGETRSTDFPVTPGCYDPYFNATTLSGEGVVIKLNNNGSKLIFSTFLGGSDYDLCEDVVIDSFSNIYVIGNTISSDFPVTNDAYDKIPNSNDGFLAKLDSEGSTLMYSTYFGGSIQDYCNGIQIDSESDVYIIGNTESSDFPTTPGAFNTSNPSGDDAFVATFKFPKIFEIKSIKLMKDGLPASMVFSKYGTYTFQVNVIDTISKDDLKQVQVSLDPNGTNIQLIWNRASNTFMELSDPNDYINLKESSKSHVQIDRWIVEFNVTFNWTYPDENFNDVQVLATNNTLLNKWLNKSAVYKVENDLDLIGELTIRGEDSRNIDQNGLVRGGEILNVSGLKVVYQDTIDIYPPSNEYNIKIWDEEGNSWIASHDTVAEFISEITAVNETILDGEIYIINITGIPLDSDASNRTFILRIDADNVTFSNPKPDNKTWYNMKNIKTGIRISDVGGGMVNGSTVMYRYITNNKTLWSDWLPLTAPTDSIINPEIEITFDEGRYNFIKWRAFDSLGNGPAESMVNRVLVDVTEVTFLNIFHTPEQVYYQENITLNATISDLLSGVNASTIEYSTSTNYGNSWSDWTLIDDSTNGKQINISLNLSLPNGTGNRVKFRAKDIAGNGPSESEIIAVNINTWKKPDIPGNGDKKIPVCRLLSPGNNTNINNTDVILTWELTNLSLKNVGYNVFFDDEFPPGVFSQNVSGNSIIISDLKNGETYYWMVIPERNGMNGTCMSGVWEFRIRLDDDNNVFKINIIGVESITMKQGEHKNIILTIQNLGNVDDIIELKPEFGILTDFISLEGNVTLEIPSMGSYEQILNVSLPDPIKADTYIITLNAISLINDSQLMASHNITIKINEKDSKSPSSDFISSSLFLILIINMIIIVILIVSIIMYKKREIIYQKLIPGKAVTIKPGTRPPVSITQMETTPAKPSIQMQPKTETKVVQSPELQQPQRATIPTLELSGSGPSTQTPTLQQTMEVPKLSAGQITEKQSNETLNNNE